MWHLLAPIVAGIGIGIALAIVLDTFWDSIANWLNNTAADVVGRLLGYNARKNMQRAVVAVSRIRDRLHNHGTIYTKKNPMDSYFVKATYEAEAPAYQADEEILHKIDNEGELTNEFQYD